MEHNYDELVAQILILKLENEDLKERLTDLLFEINYSKQKELLEFVISLYEGVKVELKEDLIQDKKTLLLNIKQNIEEFSKQTKLDI
jgi:hypothetical protein